jgi:signal peptidase
MLKALKITVKTVWWCLVVMLVLLLINILASKLTGRVPSVFGYSVMNIVSGSMEDEIPKGSYILIKSVDPEEIRLGDVICFYSSDPSIKGYPNTHRVVGDPIVTDSGIEFVTKGDANLIEDKYNAKGEDLIGRFVCRLDGLTAFVRILEGNGMFIMFGILGAAMIIMVAGAMIKGASERQDDEK